MLNIVHLDVEKLRRCKKLAVDLHGKEGRYPPD